MGCVRRRARRTSRSITRALSSALAEAQRSLEFDAQARTYSGHRTLTVEGRQVQLVPLRVGTKPIGLLAAAGRPIEAGHARRAGRRRRDRDRARAVSRGAEDGRIGAAERGTEIGALASLGHDLRTPLTAIRVAAEQPAGVLAQRPRSARTERRDPHRSRAADRLFQNILEMARIDAGAVAARQRAGSHPSEILEAARSRSSTPLRGHRDRRRRRARRPVRLDPRLTAAALAHLLENAAQYSPAESTIEVTREVQRRRADDHRARSRPGHRAGRPAARVRSLLPRRAARGARDRAPGMGLAIARGLLAAERAASGPRTAPDGGARFTIVVPPAEASNGESPA